MRNKNKLRKVMIPLLITAIMLSTFVIGTPCVEAQGLEMKFIGTVTGFATPAPSVTDIIATVEQVLYDQTAKLKAGDKVRIDAWGYGSDSQIDWPLQIGDRIEVFGLGNVSDTPDSLGCIASMGVGLLPYYLKRDIQDVKFRGVVQRFFCSGVPGAESEFVEGNGEVQIDEIISGSASSLKIGDVTYIHFLVSSSQVDHPIGVGDRVEIYGKYEGIEGDKHRVSLETTDHYIRKVTASDLPDLTFGKVGFDRLEPFEGGDVVWFGAILVNQGGSDAANFRVEAYLDGRPYDSGTISLLEVGRDVALWAEPSSVATRGSHMLTWVADTTKAVAESDETNNEMSRTFQVGEPGPTATWDLPWGLDADPASVNVWTYPEDAVAVTMADLDWSMPSGLLIWYYGGPTEGWRFYKKGWSAVNTLEKLIPGKGYIGIVPTASVWEIPQG